MKKLLIFAVPVLLLFTMPLAHAGFDERYKIWDGVKGNETWCIVKDTSHTSDCPDEILVEHDDSCNPLDLMCRQLEHEAKLDKHEDKILSKQAFYNNGRLVNPEADRMSTFDKQMKSLESTIKFLERFNLPIPDYLNHDSCVPLCWNELSSFWK